VEHALLYRQFRKTAPWKEYWDVIIEEMGLGNFDKDHKWHGVTPLMILGKSLKWLKGDYQVMNEIESDADLINLVSQKAVATADTQHTQLVLIRNQGLRINQAEAYSFLVVSPPRQEDEHVIRDREISYPTADCHTWTAIALTRLESSATNFTIGDKGYETRLFLIDPIDDNQLRQEAETRGQTTVDRLAQSALGVIDRIKHRRGVHVDPVSVMTNRKYAMAYALACHKGLGKVRNERVKLPPIIVETS